MTLLLVFQCTVLFFLSGLHFYWAFGGSWGFETTLPTTEHGKKVLEPKWFHSVTVGIVLAFFGVYYLSYLSSFEVISIGRYQWGSWAIGTVFVLRAIGDFNYVGFFKKVKSTSFGKKDTTLYSPLCLILGIIAWLVAWHR